MEQLISFNTNKEISLPSCKVYFTPKQSGSGDASSDNIRTISGWSSLNINKTKRNLYDGEDQNFTYLKLVELNDYLPPGTYTWSCILTSSDTDYSVSAIRFMTDSLTKEVSSRLRLQRSSGNSRVSATFTLSEKSKYLYMYASDNAPSSKDDTASYEDIQIESGSFATEYESYQNQNITINLDGTYYGGYIDLVNGEFVETWAIQTFSGAVVSGVTVGSNGYTRFWTRQGDGQIDKKNDSIVICNVAEHTQISIPSDTQNSFIYTMNEYPVSYYMSLPTSLVGSTVDSVKAYQQAHPITVAIQRKNPVRHTLTPQQIKTYAGRNNFWTDANDGIEPIFGLQPNALEKQRIMLMNTPHIETASGTVAYFNTDITQKLKSCTVDFTLNQPGSGNPTPTNIRPIYGFNGASVWTSGYIFGQDQIANALRDNGIQPDTINKTITYTGQRITNIANIFDGFGSGQYTVIAKYDSTTSVLTCNMVIMYTDGTYLDLRASNADQISGNIYKFVTDPNKTCSYLRGMWISGTTTLYYDNFGVFVGNVDISNFNNYISPQASVSWLSDFYGGKIDLTNGVIYSDIVAYPISEIIYSTKSDSAGYVQFRLKTNLESYIKEPIYSDRFSTKNTSGTVGRMSWYASSIYANAPIEQFNSYDANGVAEWLNTYKPQFVVSLKSSGLSALSPQVIHSLKGNNYIRSNIGDVEVKYWKH